ncbi:MAG: helicase, partial [bacterium]|nr:helicase [bacterium]
IDYPIYSQDEYSSPEAVSLYTRDENSVLMGTHSFWQGIDLPGDLLRGVIMMRLPFSVPDSPPIQARIERLKEQGLNPFPAFQVPEAIIKFKQGFGRLIRSQQDKGIVAMLDSRISSKSYGVRFIKSIPECKVVYMIKDLKYEYYKLTSEDEGS